MATAPDGTRAARRGPGQRGPAARPSSPRSVSVAIFHVRDPAPVKELVAALHGRPKRKRSSASGTPGGPTISRKGSRARDAEHGPLYLAGDNHLIFVAPSGAVANAGRRAIERALGDAVEFVEIKSVKVPKAAEDAGPAPRGRR